MSPAKKDFLSIVIPAYREQRTIERTIFELKKVLNKHHLNYEIICVVDGIVDKTYALAKKHASKNVRVLAYQINRGKGYAVQYGLSKARGNIIGFIDANGIDPDSVPMLLQHFYWYKADIVVGSKKHPVSQVVYPWRRRVISWIYQKIIRTLFSLQITDTQVGLKLFRAPIMHRILPRLLVKEFAFDIEILAVAYYLGYQRLYEAPVRLKLSTKKNLSTVFSKGFFRSSFLMFKDTLAVFYRLRIRHYYDKKTKLKRI